MDWNVSQFFSYNFKSGINYNELLASRRLVRFLLTSLVQSNTSSCSPLRPPPPPCLKPNAATARTQELLLYFQLLA